MTRPACRLLSVLQCCSLFVFGNAAPAQEPVQDTRLGNLVLKPAGNTLALRSTKSPRKGSPASGVGTTHSAKPGPWGEIEYFTVQLEVPLDLLKLWEVPSLSLDWTFVGMLPAEVERIFDAAGLPVEIREDLLPSSKWRVEGSSVIVSPSAATIEHLDAKSRNTIYAVLARFAENRFIFEPVLVPDGDVTRWLGSTDLRPEILAMIQKTLHQRGKTWIFSDKALVLRLAQSDDERLAIRKALSRTPTLIGKLKLAGADAAKLADYWSAGRRFKDIEPFLDSMIATEGADKIDLIHLLPASVRKLLYSFPNESHGLAGYYPDCHWTSLNFFNYEPLQRLAEPPLATAYTIENYVQVPKADRLGDVIFLMDKEKGNAYHSCVFIADDIVYTKNGRSRVSPWVLMKLEDVEELYGIYQETVAVAYRLKSRM